MKALNRRSALAAAAAAISVAALSRATSTTAQPMDMTEAKDTTVAPGVVQRVYSQGPAIIPGFKTVSMRDIIMQPGSKISPGPMPNAMVCHVTEGELRIVQNGKEFIAKKYHVWTCDKGTTEDTFNDGKVVGVMRVTDLVPA